MTRATRLVRRGSAAAGALALSALALALPAQGEVILHDKFDGSFSDEFELCGIAVEQEAAFSGVTHLRTGKGDLAGAWYLHLRVRFTETITNPANGKFLVIEENRVEQDVRATRVDESIVQFTTLEAGQPFTVTDMSGDIVLRDRGAIFYTILFDTLGDDIPGGEFVADIDVEVNGPHPGFFLDEDQFCGLVQDLIG
jgi:hypothetical protein